MHIRPIIVNNSVRNYEINLEKVLLVVIHVEQFIDYYNKILL